MYKQYRLIEELCKNINEIMDAAYYQDYDTISLSIRDYFMPSYQLLLQELLTDQNGAWGDISQEKEQLLQTTGLLLEAQEQKDYLLLADYMELFLRPTLEVLLNIAREDSDLMNQTDYRQDNKSVFPEYPRYEGKSNYHIEPTQQGPLTVKVTNGVTCFYLHSNVNPWKDASHWVQIYGEDRAVEYAVLGLGLGYHVISLWKRTQGAIPIHVYETDASILALAERYQDFSVCQGRNLYIHYDSDLKMLMKKLSGNTITLAIHHPSLRNMSKSSQKEALERFFIADSSRRKQAKYLYANFTSNCRLATLPVDELGSEFTGRDVFIIAAGPSLDKNVELLKERSEKSIVLATGTVFRKLMGIGITPDYVMVTDANDRVLGQIYQYRNAKMPLIVLSSAYYRLCKEYSGPKHIIYQKDFPPAEEYAKKHGYMLFETGGSVSTTALDVCIRLQAARIIFLGLDLAFTDNLAHASGTSNRVVTDQENLQPVKGYNGGVVYADHKFNMYAQWIEERLRQEDAEQIPVINATEGGRYIAGMEYRTLQDVLQGSKSHP